MIYPHDITAKGRKGSKMTDADKARMGLGILLVINIIILFFSASFFRSMGVPLVVPIIIQTAIFLWIFALVFHFFIFRYQDRDVDETDVFTQFYGFRPGSKKVRLHIGEYDLLDLKNNSYVFAVQFKFGANSPEKKLGTEHFLITVLSTVALKGFVARVLVSGETFMDTPEAAQHLKKVNSAEQPLLRRTLLNMYSNTFKFSDANCTTETIILMVYAKSAWMRDDLEDMIVQIDALYRKMDSIHAFRRKDFLGHEQLLEVFRDFYGMEAIDLSLSKINFNRTNVDALKMFVLYRIVSEDGKTYTNPVFDKIGTAVKIIK